MLGLLGAVALTVAGCEEEEQGRVLYHEKGVYQGQPDSPLDEETVDHLRARAKRQAG